MAPRRKSPARALGRPITSILMPDLKHPLSYVGRRVGIPGALWVGRQTAAELATEFKCTIREFSYAHLFSGGFVPEKAWQVQEMGVSGSGSLEVGDSSGDIFWIKNSEFLKYFYKTYPELKISPPSATAPTPGAGSSSNLNSCSGDGGGGGDNSGGGAVAGGGGDSSEWFTIELDKVGIKAASISGITPDGAADGQAGLVLAGFGEKVDTCHLHQLQRGLLYCQALLHRR